MGICEETERVQQGHQIQGPFSCPRILAETWNQFQQQWDFCTDHEVQDTLHLTHILCHPQSQAMTIRCQECLHGQLNETIYMAQPPSYNDRSGRSCLLIHSLYSLKQAGNIWNQELNQVLAESLFRNSHN